LYLDLDTNLFFGNNIPPVTKMEQRDLVSKRAHQIKPYFDKVVAHLEENNWFEKIAMLRQCMESGEPNHELAESLDNIRIQACQQSARRLKRYPPIPYSPEIARMRNIEHLLRLQRHQLTSEQDHKESIQRRLAQLNEPNFHLPGNKENCERLLKATQKDLRRMEKEERETAKRRRQHQQELQASYWEADDAKSAKIVQQIQKAEEMARVWKKCAAARGLTQEGGLSYLLVPEDPDISPKQCNEWRRIDDQEEINDRLQVRNQKHFGQAKGGKLTSPPFDITMDFEGTCAKAEAILAGTFQAPEELDDTTEWLLDSLQYVTESNAVEWRLTEEEFKGKVKVWNERTSTSPITNVHLGHAKAYFARHSLKSDSEDEKQLEADRDEVLKGHLTLLNYALQFGYSYTRWKLIVNAMLEKDPGQPKIHRLRVIHLYEYDFNLILGVKWRSLLKHCCDKNLLNDSCYGSRPGRTALDPVFTKVLELEISTLTNTALIQFDNDMTACYDRIPMFLANVLSRKYGMHVNVCCVQGKTFCEAKYYLKTRLGVSEGFVSHSLEEPWYGVLGQGAGNAPMNCL
jgi:rubrerythrin